MSLRVCLITALLLQFAPVGLAQLTVIPTPLSIPDNLSMVQIPPFATLADPQCDSDGTVYLRQEAADDSSWELTKVSLDGETQQTSLSAVPGFGDTHSFVMAVSGGGSVHEIVRAWGDGRDGNDSSIYYLQFDADGSFRSRQHLGQEFIPASLVPLPTGNFFAAGVVVKKEPGMEDVEEVPLAGIFDSEARLLRELGKSSPKLHRISTSNSGDAADTADALQQGGTPRLGDDGDLYVLLNSSTTKVRVFRQSGEFRREMLLQQPFQEGLATGLWVSSGRMLVSYEGEADDPKDAVTYILYDANTGELIRAYRPQFTGTIACFQDGQNLTVLVKEKRSGTVKIGSVQLQ